MAKLTGPKLALTIGGALLLVLVLALSIFRAPGATVESQGSPIGVDGDAPGRDFLAALDYFPITVQTPDGTSKEFTAGELGVTARDVPTIPRAWAVADWGRNYEVELQLDSAREAEALATIGGYGAPVDASLAMVEDSWTVTPGTPGLTLSRDPISALKTAFSGAESSLTLELQESEPAIPTEEAQDLADKLNGASLEVMAGNRSVVTFKGSKLADLLTVTYSENGLAVLPNGDAVRGVAELYGQDLERSRVDGEQIVDEEGKVLKTVTEPQDGFIPGAPDEMAAPLTEALAGILDNPNPQVSLAGEVDPAQPKTLMRTATVDISDHTAYFYENGAEVARFPVAVGKPGYDTHRGTFKVYAQLTSQNMGACDSRGNYRPDGVFDYCTANVPWVTYFNGDEAFHGTYWHNNFGNPDSNMSHGCVNMRVEDAEWAYRFLQSGSTVTVQD